MKVWTTDYFIPFNCFNTLQAESFGKMSIVIGEDKIPYIDLGDGFVIRLEYEDLKEEKYIEKAKNELRESPEIIKSAVEDLRRLIIGKSRLHYLNCPLLF